MFARRKFMERSGDPRLTDTLGLGNQGEGTYVRTFVSGAVALVVGGVLGVVTVVSLISSQVGAPDQSPANSNSPVVNYGSTQ